MPLTLLSDAPFSSTFSGVNSLQAMGQSWSPGTYQNGVPGSMEIVDEWFKATIRQTDPITFTGIRSEITLPAEALGSENVYTWEMQILSSEWPDHTGTIVLAQMHPEDAIVAAINFGFIATGGYLFLNLPNNQIPTVTGVTATDGLNKSLIVGALQLDHVYKLAIHTKWINNTTGFMEVLVDGVQIYKDWHGKATAYNADAPYFKLGIYDGPHLANFGTKSARFRNLKRYSGSAGYSEWLGGAPLPPPRLLGVL